MTVSKFSSSKITSTSLNTPFLRPLFLQNSIPSIPPGPLDQMPSPGIPLWLWLWGAHLFWFPTPNESFLPGRQDPNFNKAVCAAPGGSGHLDWNYFQSHILENRRGESSLLYLGRLSRVLCVLWNWTRPAFLWVSLALKAARRKNEARYILSSDGAVWKACQVHFSPQPTHTLCFKSGLSVSYLELDIFLIYWLKRHK